MSDYAEEIAQPEALEQLGSVDALRFQNFNIATFRMWENIYYQWSMGLYEDSEFEGEKAIWADRINRPSFRELYCRSRDAFSEGFRGEMDSLMDKSC